MPTLVAMARSGETFITRRERYGLWLHLPAGAGGAGPIDEKAAERAVADHGFTRINQDFETWDELECFRQREAAKFAPPLEIDPAELDGEDVLRMLDVARRWSTEGDLSRSRRLLHRLLRVPVVVARTDLHDELVAALEDLDEADVVVLVREAPSDPLKAEARRRYTGEAVAA